MMQKNEDDLLHPWLAYHGDLVGFKNLYVFDNGSSPPKTLEALAWGEALGATINRSASSREASVNKGRVFTDVIHAFEAENCADFHVPPHGDAFFVVQTETGVSADRDVVEEEFARYLGMTHPSMNAE